MLDCGAAIQAGEFQKVGGVRLFSLLFELVHYFTGTDLKATEKKKKTEIMKYRVDMEGLNRFTADMQLLLSFH